MTDFIVRPAPVGWDPSEGLYTTREVARLYKVCRSTVNKWCVAGQIHAIQPGGRWLISKRWVREDLARG